MPLQHAKVKVIVKPMEPVTVIPYIMVMIVQVCLYSSYHVTKRLVNHEAVLVFPRLLMLQARSIRSSRLKPPIGFETRG